MEAILLNGKTQDYIWSGTNLKKFWNKTSPTEKIAEVWELSLYPKMESEIVSGKFNGENLADLFLTNKELFGKDCAKYEKFPILIKLIDAEDNLSIQVHPNDEYAKINENELGKTEMWYVAQAEEGAGIYFGCNKNLTKEQFRDAIINNTVTENLNFVTVKAGDSFFIEAGTLHAILKGLTIFEVQENSNITYRVYDYDRKDKLGNARQLHIDKAIEVSNLKKTLPLTTKFPTTKEDNVSKRVLSICSYFRVVECTQIGKTILGDDDSFIHLMVISGSGFIDNLELKKGSSVFIASGSKSEINGELTYIITTVGGKQ